MKVTIDTLDKLISVEGQFPVTELIELLEKYKDYHFTNLESIKLESVIPPSINYPGTTNYPWYGQQNVGSGGTSTSFINQARNATITPL